VTDKCYKDIKADNDMLRKIESEISEAKNDEDL